MQKKVNIMLVFSLLLTSILATTPSNNQIFMVSAEEIHDVAIIGVVPFPTTVIVSSGYGLRVDVYCINRGIENENVTITVYLDSPNHPSAWAFVVLSPGLNSRFTFYLMPSIYDLGTWNLVVSLSIVPGETNIDDNLFIGGPITVLLEPPPQVPYTLEVTPVNAFVNVGQLIFFEGVVRDSWGNGLANAQVGINDPISESCITITTNEHGGFIYSVVANRAGAFLFAFHAGSLIKTSIINVGINPTFSQFPELKIKNIGKEPLNAIISVDGEEKTRIVINPGELKAFIKTEVFNHEVIAAAVACPVAIGVASGCIDTTGVIYAEVGEIIGIRAGAYVSPFEPAKTFGACVGLGEDVLLIKGEGLICIGTDGVSLAGILGSGWLSGEINVKITSLESMGLSITAHSPISIMVTDPEGRRVGYDPHIGLIDEIAWATYTGPHTEPQVINIPYIQEGRYEIRVFGLENGDYHLNIKTLLAENITSDQWINGTISLGQTFTEHIYIGPSGLPIEPTAVSVSINPLSDLILVGNSVMFTSIVSGGITPYSYQWYLNGNPVSGVTSNTWTFTPTTSGIYYVYLKVTDAIGNTAQSETARITVATVPVGGYSIPIQIPTKTEPITPYIALTAILTIAFTTIKRKTTKKNKKPP